MKKKEITELRVYATRQTLRKDFDKLMKWVGEYPDKKIIADKEIYVPNMFRIIFVLDDDSSVRGRRADKVFIDEMITQETKDYLNLIVRLK